MTDYRRWLFAVLLGVVATATTSCTRRSPDLSGRPCADGVCVAGYACHPELDVCAQDVDIDRATVGPGRSCAVENAFIDCIPGATGCEAGCFTCTKDLVWSECSKGCTDDCQCPAATILCNGNSLVTCDSLGYITGTDDCDYGCNSTGATHRCNECVPGTVACVGLDLVTCAADGTIASSVSCETGSRCSGAGVCSATSEKCDVLPQAPDGTPCDEGDGQNNDFCDSHCDGAGVCVPGTPTCDDGVVCTVDGCSAGAGCVSTPKDCSGTAGDCHGDNACDPGGAGPNCDLAGAPLNDGNACTDCESGTCDTCTSGVCEDRLFCNGASPSAECYADADCIGTPGCEAAECNRVGCAGVVLEHQACANVTGTGWDVGAPCQSVSCATDNTGTGAGAVDTDCFVSGNTVSITHLFNTSSPNGTLFNVWMHNIGDTSWDTGEYYDCTLTGVTGETQPYSFTITDSDLGGTVRHGQNCSDISRDARYCWMAADSDADNQMAPFPLDQGLHELSCQITLDQNTEEAGFDGFIFTADLGFVPDEALAGVCPDGDTDFNAGTCGTNWGPNAPATGYCSALLVADSGSGCSTCAGGTCSVCWGGSCRAEGVCDGSEPCNTDAECEMLSGACAEVPDDCSDVVCQGATVELQACADTMAGEDWGPGKPCESALCGLWDLGDDATAIGRDCYSVGSNLAMMRYTFNTASPPGTPFYIWMRNIVDSETSAPYECTITGAAGGGTAVFSYSMTDIRGTSRHGTGCGEFDEFPNYCWMAADFDADDATYDPIPLEQGRHVLSCRVETGGILEGAGFDGIIFTSDPGYVPDELAGPVACGDSDANFTTNCSNTNWSPGQAPVAGSCGVATLADNELCAGGVCCSGTCQASCP